MLRNGESEHRHRCSSMHGAQRALHMQRRLPPLLADDREFERDDMDPPSPSLPPPLERPRTARTISTQSLSKIPAFCSIASACWSERSAMRSDAVILFFRMRLSTAWASATSARCRMPRSMADSSPMAARPCSSGRPPAMGASAARRRSRDLSPAVCRSRRSLCYRSCGETPCEKGGGGGTVYVPPLPHNCVIRHSRTRRKTYNKQQTKHLPKARVGGLLCVSLTHGLRA